MGETQLKVESFGASCGRTRLGFARLNMTNMIALSAKLERSAELFPQVVRARAKFGR